ncbi:MAG: endonuclease [bacterium]
MSHRLIIPLTLIIILGTLIPLVYAASYDSYYSGITTSNSTFITDLETRIRSPFNHISYDDFDESNIANFASYPSSATTRSVVCVYSGEVYTYVPPFSWLPFSREHTWCQSWMPLDDNPQKADQHHIFPLDQDNANAVRSNHPLGKVINVTSTFLQAKYGTDSSGKYIYEPRDSHKGDAARALFYMAVKHNGVGGLDWTFSHLSTYLISAGENFQSVDQLIQWHKQDPPDKWEVDRNTYVQSTQLNRNPFVDHPEYTNFINFWNLSKLSPSYSSEPTNYATNFGSGAVGNTSIQLTWTNATGTQLSSGNLLIAYNKDDYFIPMDGVAYTDDSNLSDGKAVLSISTSTTTYTFTGLAANTTYYFRLYSYNGTGTSINYKIDGTVPVAVITTASGSLATEPTNYITNFATGTISTSSIQLTWTDAAGGQLPSGYLLVANNDYQFSDPVDGLVYADDSNLADGSAVINITHPTSGTFTFSGLSSNTYYYFRMYSYNGNTTLRNYKTSGTVPETEGITQLTPDVITLDASNIANTTATGNANLIYLGSPSPTQHGFVWNTSPNPTLALSTKTQLGAISTTGIFTGAMTGLSAQTFYYLKAFATNAQGTSYGNEVNFYTLSNEPSSHVGSFTATAISTSQINLSWTAAAGAQGYLILDKSGSAPTGTPVDGQEYTVNDGVGDASVAAVVTSGSSTTQAITGLTASTKYYFSIMPFGYDGVNAETYNYRTTATIPIALSTTLSMPGLPVIINEFSQGASGAKEWVEILVVQDNFNLQGYKLIDGNGTLSITLSGSGFASLAMGTLIVIYNGGDVDSVITPDTTYNGTSDKSLQISSLNNSGPYAVTRTLGWSGTTGAFANASSTDIPQLLNVSGDTVFGLPRTPTPASGMFTAYLGNTSSGATIASNWSADSGYTYATPGLPNGGANTTWINGLPVELSYFGTELIEPTAVLPKN